MKMKVYSIGREEGCDIVINDNSDATSRRHATLNVMSSGKMTITDQSRNGTYVNGIKISPNVPVPVTRKDNISFAHVYRLDWSLIPKPISIMQYVVYGLVFLAIIAGAIIAYFYLSSGKDGTDNTGGANKPTPGTQITDSCKTCKRPISECEFKGQHPQPKTEADSCKTCKKLISECQYKGKHPDPVPEKKCKTCGKPLSKCKHHGKHPDPVKTCTTCGKKLSECKYKGSHPKQDDEIKGGDRH